MVQATEKLSKPDNKKDAFLGIDVGSVSLKFVLIDEDENVLAKVFLRNKGSPIDSVKTGMDELRQYIDDHEEISKDFSIRSIPTLLVLKDGEVVNKMLGNKSLEEIKTAIAALNL